MKNKLLRILLVGVLILSTLFVGCGKDKNAKKNDTTQDEGPWYQTKYYELQLEENEYMNCVQLYGEDLYFCKGNWIEATEEMTYSFEKVNLNDFSVTDIPFSATEDFYVMDMYVTADGIYIAAQLIEWNSDFTKMLQAQYQIWHCDLEGNALESIDLTEDMMARTTEEIGIYMSDITLDKDGNIYVADNQSYIAVYDKEGNLLSNIDVEGWGSGLVTTADGSVYYNYMDEVNWEENLVKVDVENGKLGDSLGKLPENNYNTNLYINEDNQVYVTNDSNGLQLYDLVSQETTDILNWLDYDINGDNVYIVTELEDGRILAYCESYDEEKTTYEIITLTETDEPLEAKTVLTYATFGTDSQITDAIIRFNKNSEDYRIEVVDYYDSEDYEAGLDAFNEALLNGEYADLINVSWDNYNTYASKGLYVDLNTLIDEHSDINREDYFENVLNAFEIDGKLYAMPTSFSLSTLAGKSSIWGDTQTLTTQKISEVVKKAGDDAELINYGTKSDWLNLSLQGSMNRYINWETGECSFDSEEFIAVLELANLLPAESNWEEGDVSAPKKIQAGKLLLNGEYFNSITDYQVTKAVFGEDVAFLGYPDATGSGTLINGADNLIAISEDSEYKDAAWEFIKYMISEEYQCNYINWYNPIHKAAFAENMEQAAEITTYKNDDGEEIEAPHMTYGWEDFETSVYHATEEDIAEYTALVEGADTLASQEEGIFSIISEEVEPFFAGQKSAEEVAGIIQSRVNIYVNESR